MSRISKAIEIAKREGQIFNSNIEANSANKVNDLDYTKANRIIASKNLLKRNRVLTAIDDSRVIDTYRLLRTRVLKRMQQNKWKTLGITSAGKDDGKTLTAVNLAISIAMKQNFTVILVDADLRSPTIHKLFGFEPKLGLSDYLNSNIPVEKILFNPGVDRLVILPGTQPIHGSSELLSSPNMARLVKDLKSRYATRIVIFDLPPVLVGDDVVAFSPNLDAALIIVEEGGTESDKLKKSVELLEGVEIIGAVLNKSKNDTLGYEYYY